MSTKDSEPPNPLDAPCHRAACCLAQPPDATRVIRLALYEARNARANTLANPTLSECWLDSAIETLDAYLHPVEDREGLYEKLLQP